MGIEENWGTGLPDCPDPELPRMLQLGLKDVETYDVPDSASTRSMRYSAALNYRLLVLLDQERQKVRRVASSLLADD